VTSGISPQQPENLKKLVWRLATTAYQRMRPEHRRWIGAEDLAQEAYIGVLAAGRSYVAGRGQKLSTRAWTAAEWRLRHRLTYLGYHMRTAPGGALLELDAPVRDGPSLEVPDKAAVGDGERAYRCFVRTMQAIGPVETAREAAGCLVSGLLLSRSAALRPEVNDLLVLAAKRSGVTFDELKTCAEDEQTRRKVLLWSSEAAIMDTGAEKLRCLECVECEGLFTLAQIRQGIFHPEPMVCRVCYDRMAAGTESCFGKEYDPTAVECRLHCPDRHQCAGYGGKEKRTMTEETVAAEAAPETAADEAVVVVERTSKAKRKRKPVPEADLKRRKPKAKAETAAVEKPEKPVVKKKKKKIAKPVEEAVRKKKKAKPVAVEQPEAEAPPKSMVVWPWRRNSGLQDSFIACFHGISAKRFEELFQRSAKGRKKGRLAEYSHAYMLKHMRAGKAGKTETTHTWEFDESGGRYRIYNVKYLLKKREKKTHAKAA
jgi:hypothetical protein